MKKTMALLAALAMMTTVFVGCGDTEETTNKSAASEAVSEVEEVVEESVDELGAALNELADALNGTMWVGMDASYSTYAMQFNGNVMALAADDGSVVSGYWGIAEDKMYIFEDEELTSAQFEIPWTYDMEDGTMTLNQTAVMAQVSPEDAEDVETALQQYAAAAQVAQYLDNTYWVCIGETAEAISISNGAFEMIQITENGEAEQMILKFAMDFDNLYLLNDNNEVIFTSEWAIAEDGSVLVLGEDEFTQVSEEDAVDIMGYLLAAVSAE